MDLPEQVADLARRVTALEDERDSLHKEVAALHEAATAPATGTLAEADRATLDEAREVLDTNFSSEIARIRKEGALTHNTGASNAGAASTALSGAQI